jgi:aminopeptidase YwaD
MKHKEILMLTILILFSSCAATKHYSEITSPDLLTITRYLSSDLLQGREMGSAGDSLSRIYIRQEMQRAGLKPFTDKGFQRFSATVPVRLLITDSLASRSVSTANVVMMLEGKDPQLKNEYVIIGAHFDHLGFGGPGSRTPDTLAVHHGADDNASGTALMIELAKKLATDKKGFSRSIIFVAFSGEEKGLLGSKYFTEHMGIKPSDINLMVNFDMVGRMKEENFLQVGGVGTAAGLRDSVAILNDTTKLNITYTEEGTGPSDHFSFYANSIPVLFITTGAHLDYHTPSDTYDKINYDGMVKIGDLFYKVISRSANSPARLSFREAGPKALSSPMGRKGGVTLGIMPDFAGVVKNGLRADLVTPGKPAALGGMIKGDIIKSIEGKPVKNIEEYMQRLSELKPGQTITVEVLRDGALKVLIIQL